MLEEDDLVVVEHARACCADDEPVVVDHVNKGKEFVEIFLQSPLCKRASNCVTYLELWPRFPYAEGDFNCLDLKDYKQDIVQSLKRHGFSALFRELSRVTGYPDIYLCFYGKTPQGQACLEAFVQHTGRGAKRAYPHHEVLVVWK